MTKTKRKAITEVGTNRALMAIGAHADDIEFNVGGTLIKYHDMGYEIDYIMSTNNFSGTWKIKMEDGSLKRETPPWNKIMPQRKKEAQQAAAQLGTEAVHLDHPQRHFINEKGEKVELRYGVEKAGPIDTDTPTILTAHEDKASVDRLAQLICERNPEAVMTNSIIATDMEHTGTCLLTTKAYWQAVEKGYQGMLLHWHELACGSFGDAYRQWDSYIDVSEVWERKVELIGVHASVVPFPEQAEYSADVVHGCAQAEAFNVVSRGKRYFDNLPFGAEIRINYSNCFRR